MPGPGSSPGSDPRSDPRTAVEAVVVSPIFDHEWYAAQRGHAFATRAQAATDYVTHGAALQISPHPLFEPKVLYPGGKWQRQAPDPLSYYLAHPGDHGRSTHPLLSSADPAFFAALTPTTLLPHRFGEPVMYGDVRAAGLGAHPNRAVEEPVCTVVVTGEGRFAPLLPWVRQAYRLSQTHCVETLILVPDPVTERIARTTAVAVPGAVVHHVETRDGLAAGLAIARGAITVLVDTDFAELSSPPWPWLHHLIERLDASTAATPARAVVPLLIQEDHTVVAAGASYEHGVLRPHHVDDTPDDVRRAGDPLVPTAWGGVLAVDTEAARAAGLGSGIPDLAARLGGVRVVGAARVVVSRLTSFAPQPPEKGGAPQPPEKVGAPQPPEKVVAPRPPDEGFAPQPPGGGGGVGRVVRWAVDIAAPVAPRGRRWGDDVFARSLADALERQGQHVTIDHPETRGRANRERDDVVLTLRGLEPVPVQRAHPEQVHVLWVISHPDEVTAAECAAYDLVFAASPVWARAKSREWGLQIEPLLQCTDTTRFHPGLDSPDSGAEFLFVGNSRGGPRPSVEQAVAAGLDLTLFGDGWSGLVPDSLVRGVSVPNAELGRVYAAAGVVLNDHWADMRDLGFVSNRVFDVLATGARLLSDEVAGLTELFGDAVRTWRTPEEFRALTTGDWRSAYPTAADRMALAQQVVAEHSFDARAGELIRAVTARP